MHFNESPAEGAGEFLKITPETPVEGYFAGMPVTFYSHFKDGKGVVCDKDGQCLLCAQGEKSKFRFRVNFLTKENGGVAAKIWEQGARVYNQLKALNAELHQEQRSLEDAKIKITRVGTDKNTSYSFFPKGVMTDDVKKVLSKVTLHDLQKTLAKTKTTEVTPSQPDADDNIPF